MQLISKGLKYTYNKKTEFSHNALNGVNVVIDEGDFFGIIGQTGSGKSTFIQHLNGLITAEEGELYVGEYNLSAGVKKDVKKLKQLRSKVGMVFQYPEYQLFAETVFLEVAFGLKNFFPDMSESEVCSKVKSALETVGLEYELLKDKSPFDLSGGQKRRVAIASVLVTEPEVLVLDEPVAGLDPASKKAFMRLLHSLHGDKIKTIIIVSHDLGEVCENCNKVGVFFNGKIVKVAPVKEIFDDPETLIECGLDLPLTAKIKTQLQSVGIEMDTNYKQDDVIEKLTTIYKNL